MKTQLTLSRCPDIDLSWVALFFFSFFFFFLLFLSPIACSLTAESDWFLLSSSPWTTICLEYFSSLFFSLSLSLRRFPFFRVCFIFSFASLHEILALGESECSVLTVARFLILLLELFFSFFLSFFHSLSLSFFLFLSSFLLSYVFLPAFLVFLCMCICASERNDYSQEREREREKCILSSWVPCLCHSKPSEDRKDKTKGEK